MDLSQAHADIESSPGCEHLLRANLEAITRELELAKKQHAADMEEKELQNHEAKRQFEKKILELEDDRDETSRNLQQQKKRCQKFLGELNDLKITLDECQGRNQDLEKKQRSFDSQLFAEKADATEIRAAHSRLVRENEDLKLHLENLKKEQEQKETTISKLSGNLQQITDDVMQTVEGDVESDAALIVSLKKSKRELDQRILELQEELDDAHDEIETVRQQKERLQMEVEKDKQNFQRDIQARDTEIEELRLSFNRRNKQAENQIDELERERSKIDATRRELEQKVRVMEEEVNTRKATQADAKLKRDIKRYRALLDDAMLQIENLNKESGGKLQAKQLKSEIEDQRIELDSVTRAKKQIDSDYADLHNQYDELFKVKTELEEQIVSLKREITEKNIHIEDVEDDQNELSRKVKQTMSQNSDLQKQLIETQGRADQYRLEKQDLNERVLSLENKVSFMQSNSVDKGELQKMEMKWRETETKLDFEKAANKRLENGIQRAKLASEKGQEDRNSVVGAEQRARENSNKLSKQVRQLQEDLRDAERAKVDATSRQIKAVSI